MAAYCKVHHQCHIRKTSKNVVSQRNISRYTFQIIRCTRLPGKSPYSSGRLKQPPNGFHPIRTIQNNIFILHSVKQWYPSLEEVVKKNMHIANKIKICTVNRFRAGLHSLTWLQLNWEIKYSCYIPLVWLSSEFNIFTVIGSITWRNQVIYDDHATWY